MTSIYGSIEPFEDSWWLLDCLQAGPRLCLGKDSAYVQMKLTAALLVRFFDVHLTPDHRVHYRTMLLLTMIDGLKVTVTPR